MANVTHLVELTTALLKEQKALGSTKTLFEEGWRVILTRAKFQAGVCKHRGKHIGLSALLMPNFTDDSAWDTSTHEVAHAIAGRKHGHDHLWKSIHAKLGGNAKRTYTDKESFIGGERPEHLKRAPRSEAPILGTCPNGHISHRFKMPKREYSCSRCSRHFDRRFLIKWERVK